VGWPLICDPPALFCWNYRCVPSQLTSYFISYSELPVNGHCSENVFSIEKNSSMNVAIQYCVQMCNMFRSGDPSPPKKFRSYLRTFCVCVLLGFEFRASLEPLWQPCFVLAVFKIGSYFHFSWASFEERSS
jgi:hypothetical protein